MKIEMNNVDILLPKEKNEVKRTLVLEENGEYLQINFRDSNNNEIGGISLTKQQMTLLRDNLNTYIKNKLIE